MSSIIKDSETILEFGTKHPDAQYRKTVVGVLVDTSKEKILTLHWPIFPCPGLVVGGVETDEDEEKALEREILEETGFTDFSIVTKLGQPILAHYFADNKNVWRTAEMHSFYVQLNSLAQDEQKLEEQENFELEWMNPEEYLELVDKAPVDERNDFRPFKYMVKRALKRIRNDE